MNYNTKNTVIENVFTEEEILEIKNSINNTHGSNFITPHCQLNNFIQLPVNIIIKFIEYARVISNNNNLILTEYCHAIYQNTEKNNINYKPSLFPHRDESFNTPRFTIDYQLDANIDWDILVEHKVLSLKNNQAATFSGTHQIHWRESKEFKNDQYVEMIFCHFTDPKSLTIDEKTITFLNEKAKLYRKWYFDNDGFTNEKPDD